MSTITLFKQGKHQCLMFSELSGSEGVQSNQFLLVNGETGAILDPGGNLAYNDLFLGMGRHFPPHKLAAILASHADPDIIASLDRWMTSTGATVYISRLWERFAPHFCKPGKTAGRIQGLGDEGARLVLGDGADAFEVWALPAHFLHAEGNFQFYDPVSKILFSGDLAASLGADLSPSEFISDLGPHLKYMEGFHRRYMVSGKILRLWADMVRPLEIDMIVPQHGAPLRGPAVRQFIDWVSDLACGIDLMGGAQYQIPR
ncbi:MBL fold metallo-hydrolase [Inhella gelatinilytica]|uniref:FprA family A-type flavoprotein n=1 Tax=Inhella gelatinilytica TaxID=2795030 RepID=A0A931NEH0_9BURK|nr:MBL fold metallo-hydrolase [Inhella gelatinilytica]MBH9553220.1 FprA family A-type flavoprotein [Inhella gelatinilytica]